MTLVDCLKKLFREDQISPLSPEELRVYFSLLEAWNTAGRPEWFEYCLIPKVEPKVVPKPIPKSTLMRIRNRLQQRGLIQYVSGNGKVKNPCYNFSCDTKGETKADTKTDTNSKEKVSPTPPLKENYIKENTPSGVSKKDKLSLSARSERMSWGAFMQTFNDMLSPAIPKITSMTESRRQRVKAIVHEFGKEAIMRVFDIVRKSDFLKGHNRTGWRCDFDWIFTKNNFVKILEGNYDNGTTKASHSEKRAANEEVFRQFVEERQQRTNGVAYEVEKPF